MSISTKTGASLRQDGPGASRENAKASLEIKKPNADNTTRRRSKVSGGGERDRHHGHNPGAKAGG